MSVSITLPDGSKKEFLSPPSAAEVAQSIGARLAQAAFAAKVDGRLVDTSTKIIKDSQFAVVTDKDPEALEVLRHSCAHLLAMAVKELFPEAQVTIGPVIEDGFYYDFAFSRPFTIEDLGVIEARMKQLSQKNYPVERRVMERAQAVEFFRNQGEHFKAEIINDLPAAEEVTVYKQGPFEDLCRGPHVPATGFIKFFKLTKVSGAYWRGDSNNQMLQRIYGTAWLSQKDLDLYLKRLEEAALRDHRRIGPQLDLFHFQDEAQGAVFWHPKGWTLFQNLIKYMRETQSAVGYEEVNTPDVMDRSLWETSGHWKNFRANMFTTVTEDQKTLVLKPMNCPGAVNLFKQGLRSYRELPVRWAEFGKVHRYEPSGSLHGLMRVRHFTQDDAHVFCSLEQMQKECVEMIELILKIYKNFGFNDVVIKLSTRPESRMGSNETWDFLENSLTSALNQLNLKFGINPGEGAFYGPKLEFVLKDAIGRDWQCGTVQVDLNLPEAFDISYVTESGERKRPVMFHRAIFGSLERFIGILVEHHTGKLPAWLSPVQVVTLNISEGQKEYAEEVFAALKKAGLRAEIDLSNEKIGYKIREHTLKRTPLMLILGEKEKLEKKVTVRERNGKELGQVELNTLPSFLQQYIATNRE